MKKYLTPIIFSSLIFACKGTESKQETVLLEFPAFSIETPKGWTKVTVQGTDSYVANIAIDSKDTLEIDIGPYSWDIAEYDSVRLDGKLRYISERDTSFTPILYDSAELYQVKRSNMFWDTVNGYKAKILVPIQSGKGYTGIYIDSLWTTENSIYGKNVVSKFNLYGENLKPENEKAVLQAIKTLKFHKSHNTSHNTSLKK